jgi:hypothetical protein
MLAASYLSERFALAQPYDRYIATGTDEQRRRWQQVYDAVALTPPQQALVASFTRPMKVLGLSGMWCGDCVQQCPLIQRIAEANPDRIDLRWLDRDEHPDLTQRVPINGGRRVPVLILMAEDFEFCALAGDRTISRYRALAGRLLGAACLTGITRPDDDELNATLRDWLDEFERVQLMLRLSARLRQKYGD